MSANTDTDTDDADEASLADLGNADAAAEAGSEHIDDHNLTQEAQEDLTTTRQNLETPHAEDGGETPHEGRESHVSGDNVSTDGGPAIIATDAEPFRMTDERRVGTLKLHLSDNELAMFGKPSAFAGREMKSTLQGKSVEVSDDATQDDIEQAAQQDDWLIDWLALTLAEWSLNDEYDVEYFVKSKSFADLMDLARGVLRGGNLQAQ